MTLRLIMGYGLIDVMCLALLVLSIVWGALTGDVEGSINYAFLQGIC